MLRAARVISASRLLYSGTVSKAVVRSNASLSGKSIVLFFRRVGGGNQRMWPHAGFAGKVVGTWLQATDTFEKRHIGTAGKAADEMLTAVGASVRLLLLFFC
jgi:hypothetical protein